MVMASNETTTLQLRAEVEAMKAKENAAIALVVDSSGSMTTSDWQAQKDAILLFLSNLLSSLIYLAQFSTLFKMEIENASKDDAISANANMVRIPAQRTNLVQALQSTAERMDANNPNQSKIIIVLTDGLPDSVASAHSEIERLKQKGYLILGIGIGTHLNRAIMTHLFGDKFFGMDNWDKLIGALDLTDKTIIVGSEVDVTLKLHGYPISIKEMNKGKQIRATVTINNQTVPIREGTEFRINGCNFFRDLCYRIERTVAPFEEISFDVIMDPYGTVTIDSIPSSLRYTLTDPNGLRYCTTSSGGILKIAHFTGDVMAAIGQILYMLIVGPLGAGKSTLINAFVDLVNYSKITEVAEARTDDTHVTVKNKVYNGGKSIGSVLPLQFIDTVGIAFGNYKHDEMNQILEGRTIEGMDHGARPNCPVITISQDQLLMEESVSRMKVYAKEFIQKGLPPLVAVTHGDRTVPQGEEHCAKRYYELTRQKASDSLGVDKSRVFVLDNSIQVGDLYGDRKLERDKVLYKMWEKASIELKRKNVEI
eukprot:TRINITY_DN3073_c0_g1_i2.p1 TRINITY_DN3073_c0_g1~~TRINITY_DN3073_c0_g1_i2.p1  ORF type:complete len:557 (+),score=165.50 TRINITY_DN3073_c0_g1_i2:58-1671(+)